MRHRTQFRRFGALLAAGLLLFSLSAASAEKTVTLTFTGDCTLGGEERTRFQPDCFDTIVREQGYEYPFRYFRPLFEEDDCTVINMEGVLSDSYADEFKDKTFRFRGKTEFAEILTLASVEAAGLDNNHVNDYGAQGLRNTQETLANAGIAWFRALDIYILEKDGIRIAFLALDQSTSERLFTSKIKDRMLQLKADHEADAIVVCFHCGREYDPKHSKLQEKMANSFIRAGADLVIMNHSHVVQGLKQINNRTACFCLGNFVFGGNCAIKSKPYLNRTVTSRYSIVVRAVLTFADDGAYLGQQLAIYPAFISDDPNHNHYQPYPVHGDEAVAVIDAVQFDTDFKLPALTEGETYDYVLLPYLSADS